MATTKQMKVFCHTEKLLKPFSDAAATCATVFDFVKGRVTPGHSRPIYVRDECVQLWTALNQFRRSVLYVYGPPGTGKSTTVWAWAQYQAHLGKKVVWLSQNVNTVSDIVTLHNDEIVPVTTLPNTNEETESIMRGTDIFVWDGKRDNLSLLGMSVGRWALRFAYFRRKISIVVKSMGYPERAKDLRYRNASQFFVPSWTERQLRNACAVPAFYNPMQLHLQNEDGVNRSVQPIQSTASVGMASNAASTRLSNVSAETMEHDKQTNDRQPTESKVTVGTDGSNVDMETLRERWFAEKYTLSGGSARFLFEVKLTQLVARLNHHLSNSGNLVLQLTPSQIAAINASLSKLHSVLKLRSVFIEPDQKPQPSASISKWYTISSSYVLRKLIHHCPATTVQGLQSLVEYAHQHCLNRWVLEMDFVIRLRASMGNPDIPLTMQRDTSKRKRKLETYPVHRLIEVEAVHKVDHHTFAGTILSDKCWLIPNFFTHGGFDCARLIAATTKA